MKIYNTIIIGAGVSGLGCAKTLHDRGDDNFLVISKDIGGRVPTSYDGDVNYGAFYIRRDYKHILPFVERKRRIRLSDYYITHKPSFWKLLPDHIKNLPSLIWFAIFVFDLKRRYFRLKKRAEYMSQKEAFEKDPVLNKLCAMTAKDFIKKHKLEHWEKWYIDPLVRFTTFLHARDLSALVLCGCMAPLIVPCWEFHFQFEKLIKPFCTNINEDEVTGLHQENSHWVISTKKGNKHHAKHVVFATPIHITKKFVDLEEELNPPVIVHMAHARGTLRHPYKKGAYIMFPERSKDIVLVREPNGTFLFYSHDSKYDLDQYFEEYEIIEKQYWNPAFFLGTKLIEAHRGNNLYVIGDHNITGLEDSFITGIYAANQILKHRG